jgi:acetyltransferase-like isoleucine patch superfamily enzyme
MTQDNPTIAELCPPETWPPNISVGDGTVISGFGPFKRFYSTRDPALTIGSNCSMIGTQFAIGSVGVVAIGDYCHFTHAVLLCEESVQIGDHVVIGWNVTISDSDFHPLSPSERLADAVALSPDGDVLDRPRFAKQPITIEDDVWIGPSATILKGVHVHRGAWIEPGAVVLKDVPANARVLGNPARVELGD